MATPGVPKANLSGLALAYCVNSAKVLKGALLLATMMGGHGHQVGDGRKVFERIKGGIAKVRCNGHGDRHQTDGVAIGRGFGKHRQAQHPIATGLVVDHHRLLEFFAKQMGGFSGDHVGGPTRREGHDESDGLIGPVLRLRQHRGKP